jgi:hypothetical protein
MYGMYELENIPAGIGHLYAHKAGFHDIHADYEVLPGFNLQDIPMVPISLGVVMGQVKTPYGACIQGALVRLTYKNLHGNYAWKFAYSVNEGKFCFGDIPPGPYAVQSFAPGWLPGTAIGTVFEGCIEEEELYMAPTDETGTLEGWAVDFEGNPVPYAFAYVEYIGFKHVLSGWTIADENGHFLVEGIYYGPYAIRVESAAFLPGWAFSDILPNEEDDFLKVVYPYNPLLSGALTGTVYDAAGAPIPYAIVGCYAAADPNISYKTITDADGHYVFPLLPPTVYNVFAVEEGIGVGYGFDEVITGQETIVDIILE